MVGKTFGPTAAAACVAACFFLNGCNRVSNTNTSQGSSSLATPRTVATTVELSPSQLAAIKIELVGTYPFLIEKEELGNIGFPEDPAIIQAEATLIGAAGTFEVASKELARAKALGATNGIAQRELDQAVSDQQTAQAELKAARDAVRALGETDDEIDQMIATGKVESAPAMHKWAVANVIESDSPLIRVGRSVEVRVAAYPGRIFKGVISKIYATVDPNTHREAIRCEIDDPRDDLRVGMLANFTIRLSDPVEAIAIPANGVVREGDGTMTAWVTADHRHFTQRVIKTALQEDGKVEVLEGLHAGELVATDGAIFLDNMLQAPSSD